ncbi:hypothetical protein PINS_up023862 [Pythium insidiosum]|nr:hypothetical protein PINS_up023862 [Pythium insidiosum]
MRPRSCPTKAFASCWTSSTRAQTESTTGSSLKHTGGVFSTQPLSYTPWGGRDAVFSVQLLIDAKKGESEDSEGRRWIRGFADAIAPYLNGRAYQNYCDLEIGPNYGDAYWGAENFGRLKQIKARYDPQNLFPQRAIGSTPLELVMQNNEIA